jgi:hypothetical protein
VSSHDEASAEAVVTIEARDHAHASGALADELARRLPDHPVLSMAISTTDEFDRTNEL